MHSVITPELQHMRRIAISLSASVAISLLANVLLAVTSPVHAAGCAFAAQGDGHVAAILDARTFRLQDGREIYLAGIEPVTSEKTSANRSAALSAILNGRDVIVRADDDTPDRYGREPAFVFLASSETPPAEKLVQTELLLQGEALVSASVTDKECAAVLMEAEAAARQAKRGVWADPAVIKNTESTGDILAGIGQFMLVEGKVLSVRQAGATTYLNFGRNWTRDFAVTISRRMLPLFEAAALRLSPSKIDGFVSADGSRRGAAPRMEVLRVGQVEVLGGN